MADLGHFAPFLRFNINFLDFNHSKSPDMASFTLKNFCIHLHAKVSEDVLSCNNSQ